MINPERCNYSYNLITLPSDILFEIARHLTYTEMMRLRRTCRTICQLLVVENFGHIWRIIYRRHVSKFRFPEEVTSLTQRQLNDEFSQMMKKTRFLEAVRRGYEILAKRYLEALEIEYQSFALSEALRDAARLGYLDILDWLLSFNPRQVYLAIDGAAEAGDIELVDRLLPQVSTRDLGPGIYSAARGGHRHILEQLFRLNSNRMCVAVIGAAHGNQRQLLAEFLEQRPEYLNDALFGAATGGHWDLMEALIKDGARIDMGLSGAARGNQVEMAECLIQQGARSSISQPAQYGSLDVVNLFLSQEDPYFWHDLNPALESAAAKGYWDVVHRLLLEHPTNLGRAAETARHHGYPELATFIRTWAHVPTS